MATSLREKPCSYVRIFVDGAYSKNRMGVGVVIYIAESNKIYRELYGCVPPVLEKSNHYIAEWYAVVMGLKLANTIEGLNQFKLFNDNLVVINQLNGEARIRKAHLAHLKNAADCVLAELEEKGVKIYSFNYVSKKRNNYADALSQRSIEEGNQMLDLDSNIKEISKPKSLKQKEKINMTENIAEEPIKSEAEERAEMSQKVKQFIAESKKAREQQDELIKSETIVEDEKDKQEKTKEELYKEISKEAFENIKFPTPSEIQKEFEEEKKETHVTEEVEKEFVEKKKKKPKSPFRGIQW